VILTGIISLWWVQIPPVPPINKRRTKMIEEIATDYGTFKINWEDYPHVRSLLSEKEGIKYLLMKPEDLMEPEDLLDNV
jgi:hypothetical protein